MPLFWTILGCVVALLGLRYGCNRLIAVVDVQVKRLDELAEARSVGQAELDAVLAQTEKAKAELKRLEESAGTLKDALDEFEVRGDGKKVRKDRWRTGMMNVSTILVGSRATYEIDDIVEKVRVLAETCRADYESGGNGTPWSAPERAPCPAGCVDGMEDRRECATCDGQGTIIVDEKA